MHDSIAYTYEADHHCADCAERRFGRGDDGSIATPRNGIACRDGEGNLVGALFPWDEWWANDAYEGRSEAVLACGTCGGEIDRRDLS
jgi:hypothetical protein